MGAQAGYRHPLTDRIDLVFGGGGTYKGYRESDFETGLVNASIGPRYRFDWGSVTLSAIAEHGWAARAAQARSSGGLLTASWRLTARDVVHADAACVHKSFSENWKGSDLRYQDGNACSLSARFDHALNSAVFVRLLGGIGQERTATPHLDNGNWTAGAGVHNELPWGISLYLQGAFTNRDYDGIYPSTSMERQDHRWDLAANLTKRDWVLFGFAPQLQYTYTLNHSNIELYKYDAHGLNFTLTQRF